jgi:hypothetical protein
VVDAALLQIVLTASRTFCGLRTARPENRATILGASVVWLGKTYRDVLFDPAVL